MESKIFTFHWERAGRECVAGGKFMSVRYFDGVGGFF